CALALTLAGEPPRLEEAAVNWMRKALSGPAPLSLAWAARALNFTLLAISSNCACGRLAEGTRLIFAARLPASRAPIRDCRSARRSICSCSWPCDAARLLPAVRSPCAEKLFHAAWLKTTRYCAFASRVTAASSCRGEPSNVPCACRLPVGVDGRPLACRLAARLPGGPPRTASVERARISVANEFSGPCAEPLVCSEPAMVGEISERFGRDTRHCACKERIPRPWEPPAARCALPVTASVRACPESVSCCRSSAAAFRVAASCRRVCAPSSCAAGLAPVRLPMPCTSARISCPDWLSVPESVRLPRRFW